VAIAIGATANVSLRVNPDVDAGNPPLIDRAEGKCSASHE
jgi:diaminopimelate decarboxylase